MVTIDDIRAIVAPLPRSYEVLVRDRVKFRVGRIVYVAFSRDETLMGFGFPKEERAALVAGEPDKFLMPRTSDLRYNWAVVRLAVQPGGEVGADARRPFAHQVGRRLEMALEGIARQVGAEGLVGLARAGHLAPGARAGRFAGRGGHARQDGTTAHLAG